MGLDVDVGRLDGCIGAIYDATLEPEGWRGALAELAGLFDAGFADVCTWTHDRSQVSGLVHGLDTADYDDVLLGFWFNRNVWAEKKPVRVAGEVLSTRQMMSREDLCRSEMYHEYLNARELHEGMRFALWVDDEGLGDVSLLRPWSQGAFGPSDVELGRVLLPHLQRAATITRHLRQAEFRLDVHDGSAALSGFAAIACDKDGIPFWFNARAESMITRGDPVGLRAGALRALTPEATSALQTALAHAIGLNGLTPCAGVVALPRVDGGGQITAVVQPLTNRNDWALPQPPAALILMRDTLDAPIQEERLRGLFDLTRAEAKLAIDLLGGLTLSEIALRSDRSRNTMRSHLVRLMEKTGTSRQVDLIRLLGDVAAAGVAAASPANPFRDA